MTAKAVERTINRLSIELGKDRRTVAKVLKDTEPVRVEGRYRYYTVRQYIDALENQSINGLDSSLAQARLTRARRIKIEMENEKLMEGLVRAEDVELWWKNHVAQAREVFLAMPEKIREPLANASTVAEVEQLLKSVVYEALDEVAGIGRPDTP